MLFNANLLALFIFILKLFKYLKLFEAVFK